jgi:hypothetical protein
MIAPPADRHFNTLLSGEADALHGWLAYNRDLLQKEGVASPLDSQIATRYNKGAAVAGAITPYGREVQVLVHEMKWGFPSE